MRLNFLGRCSAASWSRRRTTRLTSGSSCEADAGAGWSSRSSTAAIACRTELAVGYGDYGSAASGTSSKGAALFGGRAAGTTRYFIGGVLWPLAQGAGLGATWTGARRLVAQVAGPSSANAVITTYWRRAAVDPVRRPRRPARRGGYLVDSTTLRPRSSLHAAACFTSRRRRVIVLGGSLPQPPQIKLRGLRSRHDHGPSTSGPAYGAANGDQRRVACVHRDLSMAQYRASGSPACRAM